MENSNKLFNDPQTIPLIIIPSQTMVINIVKKLYYIRKSTDSEKELIKYNTMHQILSSKAQ